MLGMQNMNINKIISDSIFRKASVNHTVTHIIEYCKILEHEIIGNTTDKNVISLLTECMYILSSLYKSIGLMRVVGVSLDGDDLIEKFKSNFFKNNELLSILKNIEGRLKNLDDRIFVSEILKKFDNHSIPENIKTITKEIQKKLDINYVLSTTNEMRTYVDNLPENITLSRRSYYYLQRKVKDAPSRIEIERIYFQKSKKCLGLLSELLIERQKFATLLKCNSYFDIIKKTTRSESDNIQSLVNDLVTKLESRSKKEIDRIYRELQKDGYNKKVDLCDIIYYYEKMRTRHLFSPRNVVNVLFNSIGKYFGIKITKTTYAFNLWDNDVETYEVRNIGHQRDFHEKSSGAQHFPRGEVCGYIHFDIQKREDKKILSPISIHLCQQYRDKNNILHPTRFALIAGYENLDKNCMTYSDIIYLFREFGCIIQSMSYITQNGTLPHNEEFNSLLPQIMEYIAWEKDTVNAICIGLDKTVPDHIIFMRYIDFANSIKLRCINALFDHIIHNSPDFIAILGSSKTPEKCLLALYKKIYHDVMFSQSDIMNLNVNGINPALVYQEINGSEGILYGSILTEILSFGVFYLIKKGKGSEFLQNVLNCDPKNIKKSLHKFISGLKNDSYDLYLQELIGYNEIDTDANIKEKLTDVSTNYYVEDTNCSNSEGDLDQVIQINKKFMN